MNLDWTDLNSGLDVARRHVFEGEQRVIRQMALIQELVRNKHAETVALARAILESLEDSLALAHNNVRRLEEQHLADLMRTFDAPPYGTGS